MMNIFNSIILKFNKYYKLLDDLYKINDQLYLKPIELSYYVFTGSPVPFLPLSQKHINQGEP